MKSDLDVDQEARTLFRQTYEHEPGTVVAAPGRMNIVGEHTDYNQGFVLPAAVDRHVAVALALRSDQRVRLRSDKYAAPVDLPSLPSHRMGGWADYVLGVAHEVRGSVGELPGFEAAIASQVPVGSGLSSSGAVEVATAVALLQERRIHMPPIAIARLCQRAENEFVGARTGIMDQYTALRGETGHALLLDCRSLESKTVPLPPSPFAWLLADTRVHHELAASAYNDRRAECEAAAHALGRSSLRDVQVSDLDRLTNPILQRRARHVVTENERVLEAASALERDDPRALGPILLASHSSLRDDFEVSCAELDLLVDVAASKPSVVGARMMGGGFGGCVLVLLEADHVDEVEESLAEGYRLSFDKTPAFYRVRSVDGVMPSGSA